MSDATVSVEIKITVEGGRRQRARAQAVLDDVLAHATRRCADIALDAVEADLKREP